MQGTKIEPWRWAVVWLMFLATMLNYMDRQTVGSLSKSIMSEFNLTDEGYGWIEFWFGISYGLFQFPAGFLADKLNLRWLYAAALVIWSAAGFLTGMADTVVMLMTCRVVLGLGEAFNWPCAVGIVQRLMPLESRSMANGFFHGGASIGAVATPLVVLALAGPKGEHWRIVFQVVGALGLVWVVLWFWSIRGSRAVEVCRRLESGEEGATSAQAKDVPISFDQVLWLRQFWITLAVSITVNLCWHFYRTWLPRFLDRDLKFTQTDIQYILMAFYLAADAGSMTAGYMTRRLTYSGRSVARSRKIVMIVTSLLCILSTPAALVMDAWITLPLILIVAAASMGGFPNLFALSQDISPRHTSLCLGIFGSLAWVIIAVLSPMIGKLVDAIGTFKPSLIVIGFVPLIGSIIALWWPEPPSGARPQPVE